MASVRLQSSKGLDRVEFGACRAKYAIERGSLPARDSRGE